MTNAKRQATWGGGKILTDTEVVDAINHELSMLTIRMATANGYPPHQLEAFSEFAVTCNRLIARRLNERAEDHDRSQ